MPDILLFAYSLNNSVQITGTTVEWDEMRFDVRLLQRVPAEGVSRMQTSLRCVLKTTNAEFKVLHAPGF